MLGFLARVFGFHFLGCVCLLAPGAGAEHRPRHSRATLDGGGRSRIFEVNGSLSLYGLRLTGGLADADNLPSDYTFTGTFLKEELMNDGGAILVHPDTGDDIGRYVRQLTLEGCTIDSCHARRNSGGVQSHGPLQMRSCAVHNCTAELVRTAAAPCVRART